MHLWTCILIFYKNLLFSSSATDPIAHNLDIQHRIRAQAVSGIVELIDMADERAESDDQFRKIIEGIKLDKYIEERVIADGWELIESHGSVTGCGDQWIYPRQGSTSDMRRHLAQFHQHFPIHRME